MTGYVYKIQNKINKKIYIGQTYYLKRRFREHRKNWYHNKHFKNAIDYYGINNFTFSILHEINLENKARLKKILNHLETFWIAASQSYLSEKGYNATWGGDGLVGMKFSEESRKKMSLSARGIHVGALDGRAKAINQYTTNGEFVRSWDCITDVERQLGIKVTAICNNLKGYCTQSGGFVWKYKTT